VKSTVSFSATAERDTTGPQRGAESEIRHSNRPACSYSLHRDVEPLPVPQCQTNLRIELKLLDQIRGPQGTSVPRPRQKSLSWS